MIANFIFILVVGFSNAGLSSAGQYHDKPPLHYIKSTKNNDQIACFVGTQPPSRNLVSLMRNKIKRIPCAKSVTSTTIPITYHPMMSTLDDTPSSFISTTPTTTTTDTNKKVKPSVLPKGATKETKTTQKDMLTIPSSITETTSKKKKKTTKTKTSSKKSKKSQTPAYWFDTNDEVFVEKKTNNDSDITTSTVSKLEFKIRGNPRTLIRHRTSRGIMYNPSAKKQECFRDLVQQHVLSFLLLPPPSIESKAEQQQQQNQNDIPCPVFANPKALQMTICFRMKRPNNQFIGNKRGIGRLRDSVPTFPLSRVDVDNLTKFVLDSMNHVLYDDDSQVVSLQVMKVMDNQDLCQGSTTVTIQEIDQKDIPAY